jgi:pyruvate/2-oxoglutarate/acetoin dehydrogenase E1 component
LQAAETLANKGIEAEAIDLRVLRPLDQSSMIVSVKKINRAVIIDEAWRTGSFVAEVSAQIMEGAVYDLDTPVTRVCSVEVPIPYPKHLEDAAIQQLDKIVRVAWSMLRR